MWNRQNQAALHLVNVLNFGIFFISAAISARSLLSVLRQSKSLSAFTPSLQRVVSDRKGDCWQ